MSRVRQLVAAGACLLAAAVLGAAAAAGAATPPRDQLRAFVCQRALDPPARAVSVQAVMRPQAGTSKMQMRFDLMRQTRPGGPFRLVRGRLLGSWLTPSDPTLGQRPGDIWIVNHPVVNLPGPATYRFRVSFRWIGSTGRQIGSDVQSSSSCYQPELRPDLLVRSLTVTPLASGRDEYSAVVANRGLTGAGPVQVQLTGAGAGTQKATIGRLRARSSTRQGFVAPACTPGTKLTVTVDPGRGVDEYDWGNNARTVPCPAPASS